MTWSSVHLQIAMIVTSTFCVLLTWKTYNRICYGPKYGQLVQPWTQCSVRNRTGRPSNSGTWYNFSTPLLQFYAYTAILDDRPSLLTPPVVRIFAITTGLNEILAKKVPVDLFCRFYYEGTDEVFVVPTERKPMLMSTAGNPTMNCDKAYESIFTCPLNRPKSSKFNSSISWGDFQFLIWMH